MEQEVKNITIVENYSRKQLTILKNELDGYEQIIENRKTTWENFGGSEPFAWEAYKRIMLADLLEKKTISFAEMSQKCGINELNKKNINKAWESLGIFVRKNRDPEKSCGGIERIPRNGKHI